VALITNYSTLVTAVDDYLARSDLTTYVPNFLQNSQKKLYRSLRIRPLEAALSVTISSGVAALPSDYRDLRYAYISSTPIRFLKRATPEQLLTDYPTRSSSGAPLLIAREAENFIFGPYPDSDYTVAGIYYKYLDLLSDANTTNWFTTNAPEVLLYGALLEAQPFMMNDSRIPVWQALFNEAVDTLTEMERVEKHSGSVPRARVG
jgi:hypothetical protein